MVLTVSSYPSELNKLGMTTKYSVVVLSAVASNLKVEFVVVFTLVVKFSLQEIPFVPNTLSF